MTRWTWSGNGFRVKAHVAGAALEALQQAHGGVLTPRVVVDAARPAGAPLHPCFEWDDLRAAELFREDQARHLIRSLRVTVADGPEPTAPVRAYVNVVHPTGEDVQHVYVSIRRAMGDAELRAQVVANAKRDLRAFVERYREFAELANIGAGALEQLDLLSAACLV